MITMGEFKQLVDLIVQLHILIKNGGLDSDEADGIRDQMDGPWENLSQEDQQWITNLSANLYKLYEKPT